MSSTETKVVVTLMIESECPQCRRTISREGTLTGESLVTGNTTETAHYAMKMMLAEVEKEKAARHWNGEMCGRCQDP